jgi:hypothetical protein
MSTTDQRTALIARIAESPSVLRRAVEGLSDEQLDTPYRDGGWTCRQVIHHVADSHMNGYLRFRWVASEENTTIKTYDQDVFLSALPDNAWTRKAHHPEHGEITMDNLLDIYGNHGHNHAKQITDLRARKGW